MSVGGLFKYIFSKNVLLIIAGVVLAVFGYTMGSGKVETETYKLDCCEKGSNGALILFQQYFHVRNSTGRIEPKSEFYTNNTGFLELLQDYFVDMEDCWYSRGTRTLVE